MHLDLAKDRKRIIEASRSGWETFPQAVSEVSNQLVQVDWDVSYDKLGHDIILQAHIQVAEVQDCLLQLWLQDVHPGIWIPEFRPWVASVVEFAPEQDVKQARIALIDSKWRPEDVGQTYTAHLWGYLHHKQAVESFTFQQDFTYPG